MSFSVDTASRVLNECLTTGGDYAEIFFEDTFRSAFTMISGKVEKASSKHLYGAGIRILKELQEVYGYTSDCTEEGLLRLAEELRTGFDGVPAGLTFRLTEEDAPKDIVFFTRESMDVPPAEKIAYLRELDDMMKDRDERIVQRILQYTDITQHVTVANTKGKMTHDVRDRRRIFATAVAKDGEKSQSNTEGMTIDFEPGSCFREEMKRIADHICTACITMLNAPEMVGGVYPVILNNGFGGVLFHEACGHPLEASSVAYGVSVFTGKKGEKIASDIVTAIDDGTIPGEWGSLNMDDEGEKTRRNVLIKDGILTGYMIDGRNARRMGEEATGSSRRESYRFSPTSRMTNTYIDNGTSTFEEIVAATEYGLFARSVGGGSVNPVTGEFNFSVDEGYMVEHGKITHPVRGATLIGNGATALLGIDMIANNRALCAGFCGAASGMVPTNVGQPTIRIMNMTVGGSGKADS